LLEFGSTMSDLEVTRLNGDVGMKEVAVPAAPFRRLIDTIGRPQFYSELGCFFSDLWAADHVHMWLFEGIRPLILSGFSADGSRAADELAHAYMGRNIWRHDPAMTAGSRVNGSDPALFRVNIHRPYSNEVRQFYSVAHMRDRVVMCGRRDFGTLGISFVRSTDDHATPEMPSAAMLSASDILFHLFARHVDLASRQKSFLRAFTSLDAIEAVMKRAPDRLPARLVQIGARFLYGLSAPSVGADLGLTAETILSYRKRLYQKLGVTSHRELMLWYLDLHADHEAGIDSVDIA
jgi:hypothetical protein